VIDLIYYHHPLPSDQMTVINLIVCLVTCHAMQPGLMPSPSQSDDTMMNQHHHFLLVLDLSWTTDKGS
jgi:hypothetical protein